MIITIPAHAAGTAPIRSVLDLEPFLAYARCCHPDGVRLTPPDGPDDLPNGAALLAIKNCLEAEGVLLIPTAWEVPSDAPIDDEGWRAEHRFEGRSLIAVLGEADVSPLVIQWQPSVRDSADLESLLAYLEPMLEEAERAGVRLGVQACLKPEHRTQLLRQLESEWLGFCLDLQPGSRCPDPVRQVGTLGDRLCAISISSEALQVRAVSPSDRSAGAATWEIESEAMPLVAVSGRTATLPAARTVRSRRPAATVTEVLPWRELVDELLRNDFHGPLLIPRLDNPVQYACVVGFLRGLLTQ